MHWQHLFQEHILLRGFDYADSGYVKNLKTTPDRIRATVEGTSHYHVEIQLKDERSILYDQTIAGCILC